MNASLIDASQYSPYNNGPKATLWWGFLGLILIEATVFAALIAAYFYLRLVAPAWPPAGVKVPDLQLASVNTVLLLGSSVFIHMADSGIRKGNQLRLRLGLGIGLVLALAFLTIKYIEYSGLDYRWDSHAYGSIVWTITGFHTAHVLALVLKTIFVEYLAIRGYFNRERNLGTEVNGLYWHFVVAVWIPLYLVLYYAPRLLN